MNPPPLFFRALIFLLGRQVRNIDTLPWMKPPGVAGLNRTHLSFVFLRDSVPPWCKGLVFGCGWSNRLNSFNLLPDQRQSERQHSDSTSTAPSSQIPAPLSCWKCMNRAQAYLAKTLPVAPSALDEIEEPPSVETASGAPIADAISGFLGRYLACEPHQLTVLSLWVIYTWCFERFSTATYLSVRSPESESGKSLCLELLELLCDSPWLVAGADPRTIASQLLSSDTRIKAGEDFVSRPPYTILLDDCHHALHGSDRQPLIAILNSGAHASGRYTRYRTEYRVFGPKAFAGNAPLPRSLASRCLPIVLHRRKPTDAISRLRFSGPPPDDAAGLLESVADWVEANADALAQVADEPPAGIPPGLSPHEQNCAEPLLH